ncbi:MAG: photosynthetic reaction center subunit M, partial [Comamonadaceae bacterium]
MAEYQNIFTRVQVAGAAYPGISLGRDDHERDSGATH